MWGRIGAASLLSDDRLARRAVAGDQRAFAAIYHRYHQDLYRYSLAIVGNPQDAQDALQNTMVKVLRALPGEERQIELKPWLYRIAHNESIELLRRRRPTEQLDPEQATRGSGLAEDAEARERLRRLISDLEQLPERQRGALVMRELAGLEFAEIGAALGTSAAVARQTLYEARLGLRQMDEGREMSCDTVVRALSDADGRVTRRRDIRAHLRACPDCRRFRDELEDRRADFAAVSPLPMVAATGLLHGLLGGSGGSGTGLAGAAGAGAAKSLGATAAIKSAAAVAVVATIGVGAADRGGVVDVTPWGGGSQQAQSESAGGASDASSHPKSSSQRASGTEATKGKPAAAAVDDAADIDGGTGASARNGGDSGAGADATAGVPSDGPSGATGEAHPRGRGHEKQHPDAASHGQQTAASHQVTGNGRGGSGKGQPSKPAKPSKPTQPDKPPKPVKPTKSSNQAAANGGGEATASPKAPAAPGAAAASPPSPPGHSTEPEAPSVPPDAGE
ncbi:MAG TPA: RNA polymerase sigma factor [Solirubrobacterales bacterium]|nr:RNA polymerase sigma factor [Solirubrobacterales bacterium]